MTMTSTDRAKRDARQRLPVLNAYRDVLTKNIARDQARLAETIATIVELSATLDGEEPR